VDDFVLNVRQIGQYPKVSAGPTDAILLQQNITGPYAYVTPPDLFASALLAPSSKLILGPSSWIQWTTGATFSAGSSGLVLNTALTAFDFVATQGISTPALTIGGQPAATIDYVNSVADDVFNQSVHTFNGRNGNVVLTTDDVLRAGAAPVIGPHFGGHVTAPTPWNFRANDDTVATTAFVQGAICEILQSGNVVLSYNGRGGHVVPLAEDVTKACTVFGDWALTNTPPSGDVSKKIANTAFVDDTLAVFREEIERDFAIIADNLDQKYAPLDSPQFVGIPTAPTAPQSNNSGQLATTAFVHAAIVASTTGVASWNGRTGTVTMIAADVTAAGGALLASPTFTGVPQGPTATAGTSNTQLATTAFVQAAVAAVNLGVTSFNTRTGAVALTSADVTAVGGALLASPVFTGNPQAPNPPPGDNDTTIATTAFVTQAISVLPAPVTSFNGRTGAVTFQASDISAAGGALLASPQFTGSPTAPTPQAGDNDTSIATTAFVQAAVSAVVAGVSSFNTRTGAVTLTAADVTGVGGALLANPTFTGVPAAPTASIGTNTTQLATTAFVQAALGAAANVSSFNGRTGAVTLQASDVSAVGGALLASPAFSGNPTAPTPAPGDNDTSIATTAFVVTALAAGGGVTSFNGRAGVVTLTSTDVSNAGAVMRAGDSMSGALTLNMADPAIYLSKTSAVSGHGNYLIGTNGGLPRWQMIVGDAALEGTGTAGSDFALMRCNNAGTILDYPFKVLRASGVAQFTASPTAPTPTAGDNSTNLATTAFVQSNTSTGTYATRGFTGTTIATQLSVNLGLECVVRNAAGNTVRLTSSGQTLAIQPGAAVGPGGPDGGAIPATADISFFVIYKAGDPLTTFAGICSQNSYPQTNGPTLPTGYTHWAYLTTVRRNAGSLFQTSIRGEWVYYITPVTAVSGGNSGGSWTSASMAGVVPAIANSVLYEVTCTVSASTAGTLTHSIGWSSGNTYHQIPLSLQAAGTQYGSALVQMAFNNTTNAVYYTYGSASGTLTGSAINISAAGYSVPCNA